MKNFAGILELKTTELDTIMKTFKQFISEGRFPFKIEKELAK